jgi:hypothetical protein
MADIVRLDKHVAAHGEVSWTDPPAVTTRADGVFSLAFVPPPPWSFLLSIHKRGIAAIDVRWKRLEPGTTVDLGDVLLSAGTSVSGRVVDTDGAPRQGVELSIHRRGFGPDADRPAPKRTHAAVTGAGGAFRFEDAVAAGEWRFHLIGEQLAEPGTFAIAEGAQSVFRELVVRKKSDIPAIEGTVVDELGAPVAGAAVETEFAITRMGRRNVSDREGRFRVERQDRAEGPVQLHVEKDGFELLHTPEKHAWGTRDLELVLQRGLGVDVLVTDAETAQPVEEFGVRCFPRQVDYAPIVPPDFVLRGRGRHPGGLLRLSGLHRGPNLLVVEPIDHAWCVSGFHRFELTQGTPVQHVRLVRPVTRVLQVVLGDGSAVSGSVVELVRPMSDEAVDLRTPLVELQALWNWNKEDKAMVLQKGTTDARGELQLAGPPREPLALRILGPGHRPLALAEVFLDPELAPLRIVVLAGATLSGKVRPLDVLRQFHPPPTYVAWRMENEAGRKLLARSVPGLRLQKAGSFRETHPLTDKVAFRADGSFSIENIPAGAWELMLVFSFNFSEHGHGTSTERLQALELADGEERRLELDLGHLLYGRLQGRVLQGGAPLALATVSISGTTTGRDGKQRSARGSTATLRTDAQGGFVAETTPATYSVEVQLGNETVPAAGRARVGPGESVQQDFHVRVAKLKLRVLAPDAKTPLAGVTLSLSAADPEWYAETRETDAGGGTSLAVVPLGLFTVKAWPKHLSTPESRRELGKKDPAALETAILELASISIDVEDAEVVRDIVMPAGSGY